MSKKAIKDDRINFSRIWREDNGYRSWMRVAGTFVITTLLIGSVLLYLDWRMALIIELEKEQPNYEGLNNLFQSMMIGFVGGIFITFVAKIIQKKYENSNSEETERQSSDVGVGDGDGC